MPYNSYMKILKVRIRKYKSIQDSEDLYLDNKITILAGKNESGKTAILEAIADFNIGKSIRASAIPLYNQELLPEIEMTFRFDKGELNTKLSENGCSIIEREIEVTLKKVYPNTYLLRDDPFSNIKSDLKKDQEIILKNIDDHLNNIQNIHSKYPLDNIGIPAYQVNYADFFSQIQEYENKIDLALPNITEEVDRQELKNQIQLLKGFENKIYDDSEFNNIFLELIKGFIPNFIYFDNFSNTLTYEIPIAKATQNAAIQNYARIADIDLGVLSNPNLGTQWRKNYLASKSATLSGDFLGYWNQDKVELKVTINGDNLVFGFTEDGKTEEFSMDQRSKGFQWFLSFYIQLKAHAQSKNNFLLLDEPGIYLHAKAQKDILGFLESKSTSMPVIFTTHSPYLLESDKLDRIRLVIKDQQGTKTEDKLHKISDCETLTPILTSLGVELTSGIINVDRLNNVIVEGPSDFYYLNAFKKILAKKEINFIYGGGTKMPIIGTILSGWGCKMAYLYDSDQGGRLGGKNLTKNWLTDKSNILSISKLVNFRIEDLFDKADFKKFVLKDESIEYNCTNSEYMGSKKKDKQLMAKLFCSENIDIKYLTNTSINNFRSIFDNLNNYFINDHIAKEK